MEEEEESREADGEEEEEDGSQKIRTSCRLSNKETSEISDVRAKGWRRKGRIIILVLLQNSLIVAGKHESWKRKEKRIRIWREEEKEKQTEIIIRKQTDEKKKKKEEEGERPENERETGCVPTEENIKTSRRGRKEKGEERE